MDGIYATSYKTTSTDLDQLVVERQRRSEGEEELNCKTMCMRAYG